MIAHVAIKSDEPWAKRLTIPNYPVGDAARYARVTPNTVRSWQSLRSGRAAAAASRDKGAQLSYLQLIEIAVVAGCRKAGMTLKAIRLARDYVAREFKSPYPFAQHEFATDGKDLLLKFDWESDPETRKWLSTTMGGQLAWDEIIGSTLKTFEYEKDLAIRWHVAGEGSQVIIDPRVAFGAPNVCGLPTWLLRERWQGGEPIAETAKDFGIHVADVRQALQFEGVDLTAPQPDPWLH